MNGHNTLATRGLAFVLLFVSLLIFASAGFAQEQSQAEYEAKLQEVQRNINELKQQLDEVKGSRNQLEKELETNETEIGELQKKINGIQQELESEEEKLNQLKTDRSKLIAEQKSQKQHIAQQVQTAYRLGQQSNLKLLLNQDSPEKVSRILKYYEYVVAARTDKLQTYVDNLDSLNRIEPSIVQKTDSLSRKRQQLQNRHQQLSEKQQQRQQMLARLNETIDSKDQELAKLSQDREHVEQLLAKVTRSIGNFSNATGDTPFPQLQGKLPWPTNGKIAHRYGSYRVAGKLKWDGVVIRATEGSPVRAVHHGRVVFANYFRGQGLLMIIDHGNGYMTLYAHNQTLLKAEGSWVEAGEVIASVGNSGGQAQAGLYFEIRHKAQALNPASWCS